MQIGKEEENLSLLAGTKSLQSCTTLCDPMDCSPPGSSVYGILQARVLEWVAFSFSNATSIMFQICKVTKIQEICCL